jgi:hypothetical protein
MLAQVLVSDYAVIAAQAKDFMHSLLFHLKLSADVKFVLAIVVNVPMTLIALRVKLAFIQDPRILRL